MSSIIKHRFMYLLLLCQIGLLAILPARTGAQMPDIEMRVSDLVLGDEAIVNILFVPDEFTEVRWRWNEPLDGSEPWHSLDVDSYYGYFEVPFPPNFVSDRCESYPLYAEIRDQDGTIVPLQAIARFMIGMNTQIDLIWPERAMAGYTNQDMIKVRITDNLNCTGREVFVRINDEESGGTQFSEEVFINEYTLIAEERVMSVQVLVFGGIFHMDRQTFQLTRDVTPPALEQISARLEVSSPNTHIEISGRFLDTYAPLPWAIEWQVVDRNGDPMGEPVYHILTTDEIAQLETSAQAGEGTPFRLTVPLTETILPFGAHALQISLFDRAGNGRAIDPIPLPMRHTVFVPLVGR